MATTEQVFGEQLNWVTGEFEPIDASAPPKRSAYSWTRDGKAKRNTIPAGYAAKPGTGPADQTCRTCANLCEVRYARTYYKCALMRRTWTHGAKTDVRLGAPACRFWTLCDDGSPDCDDDVRCRHAE